jgi:hypothetical protein
MDFAPRTIAGCTRYVGDMPELVVTRLSPGVVRRHGPAEAIFGLGGSKRKAGPSWLQALMVAIATLRKITCSSRTALSSAGALWPDKVSVGTRGGCAASGIGAVAAQAAPLKDGNGRAQVLATVIVVDPHRDSRSKRLAFDLPDH